MEIQVYYSEPGGQNGTPGLLGFRKQMKPNWYAGTIDYD
jgi:hypothetical protein